MVPQLLIICLIVSAACAYNPDHDHHNQDMTDPRELSWSGGGGSWGGDRSSGSTKYPVAGPTKQPTPAPTMSRKDRASAMCERRYGANSVFCTKEASRKTGKDNDLTRAYRPPTLSSAKQGRVDSILTTIKNTKNAAPAPAGGGAKKCSLTKATLKDTLTDASDADAVYRQCLRATKSGGDCTANRGNDCKKVFGGTKKDALAAMSDSDKEKVKRTRKVFREAVATRLQPVKILLQRTFS